MSKNAPDSQAIIAGNSSCLIVYKIRIFQRKSKCYGASTDEKFDIKKAFITLFKNHRSAPGSKSSPSSCVMQQITLNYATLPSASEEYIATVTMHEALHACWRFVSGSTIEDDKDHQKISENSNSFFNTAMKQKLPTISDVDNEALAWGRLHTTKEWSEFTQDKRDNRIYNNL